MSALWSWVCSRSAGKFSQTFSSINSGLTAPGGGSYQAAALPTAAPLAAQEPAPTAAKPAPVEVNPFTRTTDDNLSTFAMDVDSASFSAARRYLLERGSLPPADMVRVEEFVNAFDYGYPQPDDVFAVTVDAAPAPFLDSNSRLLRVGIQGSEIDSAQRKPAVLTFVIDISGSMERGEPPRPGQAGPGPAGRAAARGRQRRASWSTAARRSRARTHPRH